MHVVRDSESSGETTPLFLFRDASTGVTVRDAWRGDAATLSAIASRAFAHAHAAVLHPADLNDVTAQRFDEIELRDEILEGGSRILVALWGGEVVGFSQLRLAPADASVELRGIFVAPDWGGHGVGSALVAASADLARRLGRSSLWVRFFAQNRAAVRFLQGLGFVLVNEEQIQGRHDLTPVVTLSRAL